MHAIGLSFCPDRQTSRNLSHLTPRRAALVPSARGAWIVGRRRASSWFKVLPLLYATNHESFDERRTTNHEPPTTNHEPPTTNHQRMRLKLTIEYAGTRYSGWQIQKNARTVQG